MTGITGRTTVSSDVEESPVEAASIVELPAPAEELACSAARLLGWPGVVLPEMILFGRRVHLVVEMMAAAHAERICLGQPPVTARADVLTWAFPELAGRVPDPAVRIVGTIAVARHWRTGLAGSVPFLRYGDAATVLPTCAVMSHDYVHNGLPRARAYGVAVVTADPDAEVGLDLSGRTERACVPVDGLYRWISEMAYDQMLAKALA